MIKYIDTRLLVPKEYKGFVSISPDAMFNEISHSFQKAGFLQIEIDCIEIQDNNIHTLLQKAFGFPDYYGMNWDAFDECIGEFFGHDKNKHTHILIFVRNIDHLAKRNLRQLIETTTILLGLTGKEHVQVEVLFTIGMSTNG